MLGPEASKFWNAGRMSINARSSTQSRLYTKDIVFYGYVRVPRLGSEFNEATLSMAVLDSVQKLGYGRPSDDHTCDDYV